MHFEVFIGGFLMSFCISNIQAKPLLFSAYQDEGFDNDLDDYFIDLDTSRTPILRVNPFALPSSNEPSIQIYADNDGDQLLEDLESPVVYAERFEHAFDEAAERLENILRLAVKKFKESFIHSFEIITNSSATEESTFEPNTAGEKVVGNITTSVVDGNKENETKIEENNTAATESANKGNLVEGNANKAIIEAKPTVDKSETTTKVKNAVDVSSAVDIEVKPDGEEIPKNEVKPDVGKVEDNKTPLTESDKKVNLMENNSNKATIDAKPTVDINETKTAVDSVVKPDSKVIPDKEMKPDVEIIAPVTPNANESKQQ